MRIRPITDDDQAAVAVLADRLTESIAAWRDAESAMTSVRGKVDGSVASALSSGGSGDEVDVLVAEVAGSIAGFVSVTTRKRRSGRVDGYVSELVVGPAHEGLGVGRALVEAAAAWGRGRGVEQLGMGAARRSRRRLTR